MVHLTLGEVLQRRDKFRRYVYFPRGALILLIADTGVGRTDATASSSGEDS